MPYLICGLIIFQREEPVCAENELPFVTLDGGVSLIRLDRAYLFLTDGDLTDAAEVGEWFAPPWLSELKSRFSRSAYIEADFGGGFGMQASLVWEGGGIVSGPEISSGAINAALHRMGIDDGAPTIPYGLPLIPGEAPFDMVGLGRQRSTEG